MGQAERKPSSDAILVAPPEPMRTVYGVRGTLVVSSQASLRQVGLYDRYCELLPGALRENVLCTVAASWVSIELAMAHYAACDGLSLSPHEATQLGQRVGDRIQGTFMVALVRALQSVGVTPWTLLGQFDRFWDRLMRGGGVRVIKEGPKQARIDILGLPLLKHPYFRHAFVGVFNVGFQIGTSKHYLVRICDFDEARLQCMYAAQWA